MRTNTKIALITLFASLVWLAITVWNYPATPIVLKERGGTSVTGAGIQQFVIPWILFGIACVALTGILQGKARLYFLLISIPLLAAVGILPLREATESSKGVKVHVIANQLANLANNYIEDNNELPTGAGEEIAAKLIREDNGYQWTDSDGYVVDPWGTRLKIEIDQDKFKLTVRSAGRNRKFESKSGSDDIEASGQL